MSAAPHTLRIGLLEDQPLFREMLQHLLSLVPGFSLQVASTVAQTRSEWNAERLDVALLDYELPDGDGLEVGRALQQANPSLGVVLLSAVDRSVVLLDLEPHEAERWSFLSKNSSVSTSMLIRALRASAEGRCVIDPVVVAARKARAGSRVAALSERQGQVLTLIAEGLTNQAIAEQLGIAVNSVNNHVNSMYNALGLNESARNPRVSAVRLFLAETV